MELSRDLYFNQPCLKPEDARCSADEYFKETSYIVNLQGNYCNILNLSLIIFVIDLYQVVDTCYYNDQMPFCPVLLKIGVERIQRSYGGCQYLLQIWDMKQIKTLEIPLKSKFLAPFSLHLIMGKVIK